MSDALQPFAPTRSDPFDLRKCGHLLRRAGFGASLQHRQRLVRDGLDAALAEVTAPPAPGTVDALLQEAIALAEIERVRAYRVLRALDCSAPLAERMSVFWHGHFATGNQKVLDPRAMALQFATFDRCGLGTFDELCTAMGRDPALLRWLDNDTNVKGRPNENFARELFELFTLGRGNYGEDDVREAARAFTGHEVHDGAFTFVRARHDGGEKRVLGQQGPFAGDDVVALAVRQPASARFLARKWLLHFVQPDPLPEHQDELARCYEQNDRHVGRTLAVLLRSRLFFAPTSYRSRVKSPADFAIGLVRALGSRAAPSELARAMARMGEVWCEPPSVEGWHGDRAWLTGASWLLRSNFAADLLAGRRGKLRPAVDDLLAAASTPEQRCTLALLHLLDGDAGPASRERLLAFARTQPAGPAQDAALLHSVTLLPEYQLL